MTQEEKQLLLIDLCARLPYGVKLKSKNGEVVTLVNPPTAIQDDCWNFKPYLRPMSSMTEEEQSTLDSMCDGVEMVSRLSGLKMFDKAFVWLNQHHFDYRGLIPMGLALEAPEEMYKNK